MHSNTKPEYQITAHSGIIAASLSADAVLFHFRNPTTNVAGDTNEKLVKLRQLIVKWRTITGYTSAQELSLAAYDVSAFGASPADYTGGTSLGTSAKVIGPHTLQNHPTHASLLSAGNCSIATTAGLSHVGSPTIATHPFAWDSYGELAAASTVAKGAFDLVWTASLEGIDDGKGRCYQPGTGFVLRNPIALGAGGTGRIFVDVIWSES